MLGSSKTAPSILIFSIAMGANYSFYVKFIATFALTFFGYIISVLASVDAFLQKVSGTVGRTSPTVPNIPLAMPP